MGERNGGRVSPSVPPAEINRTAEEIEGHSLRRAPGPELAHFLVLSEPLRFGDAYAPVRELVIFVARRRLAPTTRRPP
jgi:hypothetical protein